MKRFFWAALLLASACSVALVGASAVRAADEDEFLISKVEARLYSQIVPTGFQADEIGQPGNGVGPGQQ